MEEFKEDDFSTNQREFMDFLEEASSQNVSTKKIEKQLEEKELIHLNSLITKNISLFTKNPNYKMLTWLIFQLLIFSSFIFVMSIFRNNLIPYLNSL